SAPNSTLSNIFTKMLSQPQQQYTGFQQIKNPNRQWPDNVMTKPPVWLSTDLRDGNQSLTNPLTAEQKWEYFQMLVEIGYKEIEVSFPAASKVEFDFTRRLIDTPGVVPDGVCLRGLAPTREDFLRRTVDALQGAKTASVCTYICVSDKQLKYQGFSREKAVDQAVKSVKYLRSITKDDPVSSARTHWSMAFGLESYNEAEHAFALHITEAVMRAWEPTVEEPMTVVLATSTEVATPNVFADQIEVFRASLSAPEKIRISIHPHNDRGTGVASAELGILAGADMVEGCLFGNGERSGNVDLVTLALNLYSRGIHPGLDFSDLYYIRRQYEKLTGLVVGPRTPYAGEFALQAFSGSHQNIIRKGIAWRREAAEKGQPAPIWDIPYLPIDPEDLGIPLDQIIRVNSQSGKAAATWILHRRWGLDIPTEMQVDFGRRVQIMCEALAREITHEEVMDLFVATYALGTEQDNGSVSQLDDLSIANDGTLHSVHGVIYPANGLILNLHGSANDLATAALQSLKVDLKEDAVVDAKIQWTQQLATNFGRGRYCALATCTVGKQAVWGYFIDDRREKAQVLAVISAALVSLSRHARPQATLLSPCAVRLTRYLLSTLAFEPSAISAI
ncbi:uncharacterized protein PG998_005481, partial [Apiospora kogelbergensis]|uniref:uncharacterized protein n=1 Tax=Apiospora kogelbergensis TaxID=1337665 RepID=UPI00312D8DAE